MSDSIEVDANEKHLIVYLHKDKQVNLTLDFGWYLMEFLVFQDSKGICLGPNADILVVF